MVSLSDITSVISILSIITLNLMLYIINTDEYISLPLQNKIGINRKLIISQRFHAETIAKLNTNATDIPAWQYQEYEDGIQRRQSR